MAKLNDENAKAVGEATTGFEPMPEGVYHFMLKDVDPERSGKAGPYWSWEFECVEEEPIEVPVMGDDGNPVMEGPKGKEKPKTKMLNIKGRKQWNNTSLSQAWSLKQTFDAFGVAPDTDTDELVGQVVKLQLSIRTIAEGNRKGELTNNVDRVLPADEDVKAAADKRRKDAAEMAEIF